MEGFLGYPANLNFLKTWTVVVLPIGTLATPISGSFHRCGSRCLVASFTLERESERHRDFKPITHTTNQQIWANVGFTRLKKSIFGLMLGWLIEEVVGLGWFIQIIWGRGVFKCVCIIGLCGLCQNLKSSVNNDTRWRRKAHISSEYCPKYY